jgi:hypothetical protein
MQERGLLYYWVNLLLLSVVVHAFFYRYMKSETVNLFFRTCLGIAVLCSCVWFSVLWATSEDGVKPGWAVPLLMIGTVVAFPAPVIGGLLFHFIRIRAVRYAAKRARC